jgi:hypothetical protein
MWNFRSRQFEELRTKILVNTLGWLKQTLTIVKIPLQPRVPVQTLYAIPSLRSKLIHLCKPEAIGFSEMEINPNASSSKILATKKGA